MNVYVPTIPRAVYFMQNYEKPPWRGCRGLTLLKTLGECSREDACDFCQWRDKCTRLFDAIIDNDIVVNWDFTERHVTKYYK